MAVRFSITVFLASIILFVSVIVLVNVAIIIWGLAASSFSSLSSRVKAWWHSRPVLLFRLGGVTTLRQKLNYNCTMCQDSMEAGEKVRTLSCDHVFHYGATVKCQNDIDEWFLTAEDMSCPICRQVPHPVLPWKRPPPSSPAPSSPQTSDSDSEEVSEELLFPSHWFDETLLQADSEAAELLFPSHWFDETLPEGSPSQ
ncbi:unnamed protein product [Miscanthus lutarioriparius]|uniref:RING-type domain-containing protein n=1 Tax=Miscanthus lutarioriparius TaxID=422564 RepID=A0A811QX82_9POAL|nr:unnamed protein product [Miscanthus lutarioriparius]